MKATVDRELPIIGDWFIDRETRTRIPIRQKRRVREVRCTSCYSIVDVYVVKLENGWVCFRCPECRALVWLKEEALGL